MLRQAYSVSLIYFKCDVEQGFWRLILLGSAFVLIEDSDSKDTRDSSFSAKSSRHFESRSSLHVSDLAALTISCNIVQTAGYVHALYGHFWHVLGISLSLLL